jgi:hypothetical protein
MSQNRIERLTEVNAWREFHGLEPMALDADGTLVEVAQPVEPEQLEVAVPVLDDAETAKREAELDHLAQVLDFELHQTTAVYFGFRDR